MKEPIAHWPGRLLELGGATVHVRSTPEGPDEAGIFVHGLAGSATNWTDLMGELSGELAGHAIDLPGAGYSPAPPDGDYSVSGHARAVLALVEHVAVKKGAGPVHLFGNSLGGAVSVRVAAMRPDLVRTLTLVSPALPDIVPRYGPARVALSATPGLGDWVAGRLRYIPAERRIRATMAMCYADSGRVHPERLRDAVAELVRRDGLPYSGRALVESARGIVAEYFRDVLRGGDDSLWRQAARVQAPTLVVHGMRDRLVHARTAARAARTIPDVRLVVLPKAAHVAQMEYPEVVAREVRALIRHARARV
jgi:pimeloyl-ACP methyl ester carboxylesterase